MSGKYYQKVVAAAFKKRKQELLNCMIDSLRIKINKMQGGAAIFFNKP